jgi:hypothetical protein
MKFFLKGHCHTKCNRTHTLTKEQGKEFEKFINNVKESISPLSDQNTYTTISPTIASAPTLFQGKQFYNTLLLFVPHPVEILESPESITGKPRTVTLQSNGTQFLHQATQGKNCSYISTPLPLFTQVHPIHYSALCLKYL